MRKTYSTPCVDTVELYEEYDMLETVSIGKGELRPGEEFNTQKRRSLWDNHSNKNE